VGDRLLQQWPNAAEPDRLQSTGWLSGDRPVLTVDHSGQRRNFSVRLLSFDDLVRHRPGSRCWK
jgi:hypothetical protein